MAITKTHPIKSTLKAAIDYICNPEKTDGKLLVSSYGLSLIHIYVYKRQVYVLLSGVSFFVPFHV